MKLKLKGRFESIPMMAVLCIFAAGLVAVLPLRTYQLMRLIEPETGFIPVIAPRSPRCIFCSPYARLCWW